MSSAKLTEEQVVEMRELRAGGAKVIELAEKFQMTEPAIRQALQGRTWSRAGGPLDRSRVQDPRPVRDMSLDSALRIVGRQYEIPLGVMRKLIALAVENHRALGFDLPREVAMENEKAASIPFYGLQDGSLIDEGTDFDMDALQAIGHEIPWVTDD